MDDDDINTLYNKVNEFKEDDYLKTKSSWWVGSSVTENTLIKPVPTFNTTINNFVFVKCRNVATNTNGCSSTPKSAHECAQTSCNPHGCNETACNPYGCNETACNPLGCN